MSKVKPADVRFYFDADVLGIAKLMVQTRPDVTYPGDPGGVFHKRRRPPCIITAVKTEDDVWIPQIAAQGLLIITKDNRIQTRLLEKQAVREHGAKMVALAGLGQVGNFDQLEVLMCQWRRIEACLDEKGPFIYSATRTSFRPVSLT